MPKSNFDPSDDRFIRGIIRRKSKQLIRRPEFCHDDLEDLEQDLLTRVVQSLRRFDPEVAHLNRYVTAVVERFVANVVRDSKANKRDRQRTTTLNVMIQTEAGPTELAQTIGDRELDARLGRERRSEHELHELALDLASVIATLPEAWRTLLQLRKSRTMPAIAEEMNVPRTTLNAWMHRIRQRCEDAGLKDYLES